MKIALIAPSFFGYSKDILDAIAASGHVGRHFPDRPSESVLFKSVGRISYSLLDSAIAKYFDSLLSELREMRPGMVLVVGGMSFCFSREQVEQLKEALDARLIAYLWDAVANCQRIGDSLDLFDGAYSFERKDCAEHGLAFLPLFYTDSYGSIPLEGSAGYEYDACFIGSVHQVNKLQYVKAIVDGLRAQGARVFAHYYMPSKSAELLRKMQHGVYRDADLSFEVIPQNRVADLFRKSKTIIDAPQTGQTGMTMRSIECVGAQRKLITANPDVVNYDFYEYDQALYLPYGDEPNLEFVLSAPTGIPDEVRVRYSIHSWVDRVLETTER